MKYIRLATITTSEFSHIVANTLFDCGALGVEIVDPNDLREVIEKKKYWDYIDETAFNLSTHTTVIGFFEETVVMVDIINEISKLKFNSYFETGSLETSFEIKDSSDYENAWKKYYKPVKLGGVTIVPEWLTIDAKDTIAVRLDPGAAFGTGSHETTQMCISLMQKIPTLKNAKVLDMGAGSGILGITALALKAKEVTFVDIDSVATVASQKNIKLNNLDKNATFITGGFDNVDYKQNALYDIILANLTADLHKSFYSHAKGAVRKGGYLVASGVLKELAPDIKKLFFKDFALLYSKTKNNWVAFVFVKK